MPGMPAGCGAGAVDGVVPDGGAAARRCSGVGAGWEGGRGKEEGGGGRREDHQQRGGQCSLPVHAARKEGHQPGRHGRMGGRCVYMLSATESLRPSVLFYTTAFTFLFSFLIDHA
jgi:hypothetical protein